jgi:hypothetical protein
VIWGNRVGLAWLDPDEDMGSKLVSTVPITCFVLAAVAVLAMQATRRSGTPPFRTVVAAFSAGTIVYWVIRLPLILSHDHPVAFKVVHTLLAAASVALAWRAWQARADGGAGHGVDAPARRTPQRTGSR